MGTFAHFILRNEIMSAVPSPLPTTYTVTFVERNLKNQSDGKTKVSMISISMDASLPLVLKTLEQTLGHKPGSSVGWKFSIAPPSGAPSSDAPSSAPSSGSKSEKPTPCVPSTATFCAAARSQQTVEVQTSREPKFKPDANAGLVCMLCIAILLIWTPATGFGLTMYSYLLYKLYNTAKNLFPGPPAGETTKVYAPVVAVTDDKTYPGELKKHNDDRDNKRTLVVKGAVSFILLWKIAMSRPAYYFAYTVNSILGAFGVAVPLLSYLPYILGFAVLVFQLKPHLMKFNGMAENAPMNGVNELIKQVKDGKYKEAALKVLFSLKPF